MNDRDIANLYDEELGRDWNRRVLLEKERVAFEIKTLSRLISAVDKWLDVACGTGFFLSKFSEIKRAGFDISPAMVKIAQQNNPSAMFIRVADYRNDFPEWAGQWGLVSCMWQAYSYVNTMAELEHVIQNLATWTADDGICFVPFGAPFGKNPDLPYQRQARSIWGGQVVNSGVIWSWIDEQTGKIHKNLIEPHPEHMKAMFKSHFNVVEVIEYPSEGLYAIIATEKNNAASSGKTRSVVNNLVTELIE